jgi:hypothetical protein
MQQPVRPVETGWFWPVETRVFLPVVTALYTAVATGPKIQIWIWIQKKWKNQ